MKAGEADAHRGENDVKRNRESELHSRKVQRAEVHVTSQQRRSSGPSVAEFNFGKGRVDETFEQSQQHSEPAIDAVNQTISFINALFCRRMPNSVSGQRRGAKHRECD